MTAAEVEVRGLHKAFSGVRALRGVDLRIAAGDARGLIGENGAGKSTLVNVVSGVLQPDSGLVLVRGEAVRFRSPHAALKAGIGTVHQQNWLVPSLSAIENVELGHEKLRTPVRLLPAKPSDRSLEALEFVGLQWRARQPVGPMSLADRQLVAVARALSRGSRLMIFDEPTAALSPAETERLFALIDRLRAQGNAVLYLTHRLNELPRVVERVTVMRDGEVVGERAASTAEPELIDLMAGRETLAHERGRAAARRQRVSRESGGYCLLSVESVADAGGSFSEVEFEVPAGEVVGIVGLPDSGAAELTQALAGGRKLGRGELRLEGNRLRYSSPRGAVCHGIAYLAGDRARDGVIPNSTVGETITLAALPRLTRAGLIPRRRCEALAHGMARHCQVRPLRLDRSITTLSGGNQQKALFARLIATSPRVLICEEATAGVDVGGREALYELVAQFCEDGNAVVWRSSDLREVALLCDRALALWRGRSVGELDHDALSVRALMAAQFNRLAVRPGQVQPND